MVCDQSLAGHIREALTRKQCNSLINKEAVEMSLAYSPILTLPFKAIVSLLSNLDKNLVQDSENLPLIHSDRLGDSLHDSAFQDVVALPLPHRVGQGDKKVFDLDRLPIPGAMGASKTSESRRHVKTFEQARPVLLMSITRPR